ncbi:MAG TPA: hypothetical protein VHE30_16185 [Polyangiaceae bacterium]|nr:hypothetical protein [Polyangiaceae bacterium]
MRRPRRNSALALAGIVALLHVSRRSLAEGEPEPGAPTSAGVQAPSPEPVRVTYAAPPDCPDEAAFLALVRARVGTGWEAPPGVLARTFEVRVASDAAASVARVDYADESGTPVSRTVTATTCTDVVAGIALVTALAIDARLAHPEPAAPPVSPIPAPLPPPPVLAPPPPAHASEPAPPGLHLDVGAGAALATGVGIGPAFGNRAFLGMGLPEGPDFRLGLDVLQTRYRAPSSVPADPSQFVLYALRASGCPLAFGRDGFRALPCVGIEAGVHHARGLGCTVGTAAGCTETVAPGSASPAFFAPFLSARGEFELRPMFFEAEAAARFPIGNHKFRYETAVPVDVYAVPPVAFGASLGVGLRL